MRFCSPGDESAVAVRRYGARRVVVIILIGELTVEHLLSKRITMFRERLEMSQEALAKAAGLELALVQAIESEQVYPRWECSSSYPAHSQRLGTSWTTSSAKTRLSCVRKNAKRRWPIIEARRWPVPVLSAGRGKTDRHMEPFFIEIEPEQAKDFSHEEFIIVISGEVELLYGKKTFTLARAIRCTTIPRPALRRRRREYPRGDLRYRLHAVLASGGGLSSRQCSVAMRHTVRCMIRSIC